MQNKEVINFLNKLYDDANKSLDNLTTNLSEEQIKWVDLIVDNEKKLQAVFTVLVSSLTYKSLHPDQDVRFHKTKWMNGYSGRSFDTKNVTPFLQEKDFRGKMRESGWLTRSLEQPHPFNLNFPGHISIPEVKDAFLYILNDIEENNTNPKWFLELIFKKSIIEKNKIVDLINPIDSESVYTIDDIIKMLHDHFYFKYKSRGASILPVIAIYSVYECIMPELYRFDGKYLEKLNSHTSSDRSSKAIGDIMIRNMDDNSIYESVEVKFNINIDFQKLNIAYDKIKNTKTQRYYILTTGDINKEDKIQELIKYAYENHGVQIILNGVFSTIKYYLRLIKNTEDFINNYIKNLKNNDELDFEHKESWNQIFKN
ncbi:MAG: hypothetical protein LBT66_02380 [Methanobrevibacter sp.]|nr:hypothetical protein [Candidatus Methanovirga meridionalis]